MKDKSKSWHVNSNFLKRREFYAFIVEIYEFDDAQFTQIDNILRDVIEEVKINISILSSINVNLV